MGSLDIQLSINLLITEDPIFHNNPYDESQIIIFIFDFIKCFKNLRNHILDNIMKFLDGSKVCKQIFPNLEKKLTDTINVALGNKIKIFHVNVKKADRICVKYAH